MGALKDINNAIVTALQGIQYNSNPAFKEVKNYSTQQFSGYPSATVFNGDTTSEYDTQQQNLRQYVVMIYMWFDLERNDDSTEWDRSRDYVDLVLDAIDKSADLSATCDFVEPTGMQPYNQTVDEAGEKLVAPIRVICKKSIDLWT